MVLELLYQTASSDSIADDIRLVDKYVNVPQIDVALSSLEKQISGMQASITKYIAAKTSAAGQFDA